jgi:hypothetical protein
MTSRIGALSLISSLSLFACSGTHRVPATTAEAPPAPRGGQYGHYAPKSAPEPSTATAEESGMARGAAADEMPAPPTAAAPAPEARPGLGTSWGESLDSRITSTTFTRANGDTPFATAAFLYNDEEGISAQTHDGFLDWNDAAVQVHSGITVSLTDPNGRPLRGMRDGARTYALGHDGDRYVIHVDNHTRARLEAVATVDGLDVMDGDDGSYEKRGYVIAPYDSLDIEGFRDSQGSVRAFRFGATDDSYASRRGKGRNVGVVGVALFRERGSSFGVSEDEVQRRESADPFPNRFAPAPPNGCCVR